MSYRHVSRLARPWCQLCGRCSRQRYFKIPDQSRQDLNTTSTRLDASSNAFLQTRFLQTSSFLSVAKSKNSKKKIIKARKINPKSIKLPVVSIHHGMTVKDVADSMGKDVDHVFEVLMQMRCDDKYPHEDSVIGDLDVMKKIVKTSGMKFQIVSHEPKKEKENKDIVRQPPPDPGILVRRPPVVTIMGHVDHGKTTLLDALRHSHVVDQEFGGITQHIGAFSVKLESGEAITFLDTPGHAAFTAMRARGARVTDIIVLVVAADDGVMEQTKESIEHAKEANVPIIVAINKIDKAESDVERTKKMLIQQQIELEDVGGDIQVVPISALKGTNLDVLQEAIATQAELMDLKGDPKGLVEARVIESRTDPGRGRLVTAVIERGTLKKGDLLVAGCTWVKVRGMFNDKGQPIQQAPPSTPVEIIGWKDLPSAGEEILQVETMQILKEAIDWRTAQEALEKADKDSTVIEEKREEHNLAHRQKLQQRLDLGLKYSRRTMKKKEYEESYQGPQLSLIIKGDVDGSVEAILDTLDRYNSDMCRLDLIHYGLGNITVSDIELAEAFHGEIFGFNVAAPESVMKMARSKSIRVKTYKVIYKLFDELIQSLTAKLPLAKETEIIGVAEVKATFDVSEGKKKISVAGCRCVKGVLKKKHLFRVLREKEIIYDGELSSMKHFKAEVDTIKTDVECGLSVPDRSVSLQSGDIFQCYELKEIEQTLDWNPGF